MKSLAELDKFREQIKPAMMVREGGYNARITVYVGDCGITAGARDVTRAILDELKAKNISTVAVLQASCFGECENEPVVEVDCAGSEKVTYAKINIKKARKIVNEHLINGRAVEEWTISRD